MDGWSRGLGHRTDARDTTVALRLRVQDVRLADAGRRPTANHRITALSEAGSRHFERERGHVVAGYGIRRELPGVGPRRGQLLDRILDVDQIERLAEIHDEGVLALSDKQPPRLLAPGNIDGVDEAIGVSGVIGNRLRADVVEGR